MLIAALIFLVEGLAPFSGFVGDLIFDRVVFIGARHIDRGAGDRVPARVDDLSLDGALIETQDLDVAIGDEVFLAFKAPRTRFWMDARARVVRLVRGRRREDRGKRGIGIEFVEMDGVYRAVLRGALQYIPPPAPTRPYRQSSSTVTVALV